VLWICPSLALILGAISLTTGLGVEVDMNMVMPLVMGFLMMVLGNYMPKCAPNYTVGIRLPWTLHDEENWRRTHRFAGFLWMIGGILLLPAALLSTMWVTFAVVLVLTLLPVVYSFLLYLRTR
jgi:uncharacterized membrane protein